MSNDRPGTADSQQRPTNEQPIVVRLAPQRPREPTPAEVLASMTDHWPPTEADLKMMAHLRLAARTVRSH
ncbi:MAG: hypothetical protein F4Z28_08475 [Gammaproteobacteria bacterium]|nr:hypothetical protein [Gammaproteobacteria bacterium]